MPMMPLSADDRPLQYSYARVSGYEGIAFHGQSLESVPLPPGKVDMNGHLYTVTHLEADTTQIAGPILHRESRQAKLYIVCLTEKPLSADEGVEITFKCLKHASGNNLI